MLKKCQEDFRYPSIVLYFFKRTFLKYSDCSKTYPKFDTLKCFKGASTKVLVKLVLCRSLERKAGFFLLVLGVVSSTEGALNWTPTFLVVVFLLLDFNCWNSLMLRDLYFGVVLGKRMLLVVEVWIRLAPLLEKLGLLEENDRGEGPVNDDDDNGEGPVHGSLEPLMYQPPSLDWVKEILQSVRSMRTCWSCSSSNKLHLWCSPVQKSEE